MKRMRGSKRAAMTLAAVLTCALASLAFVPQSAWASTFESAHEGLIHLFQTSASYIYLVLVVALVIAAFAFIGVAEICRRSSRMTKVGRP